MTKTPSVPVVTSVAAAATAALVTAYLASRQLKDSGENKGIVARAMKAYPGPRPVSTEVLLAYVDRFLLR